jgi:hypothetical protein
LLKVNFDCLHLSCLESWIRCNLSFVDGRNEFDVDFAGASDVCFRKLCNLDARLPVLDDYVSSDVRLSLFSCG